MRNSTYAVAYLLRKTGLSLADIRLMSLAQFRELFKEVSFQESEEEYRQAHYLAHILVAITNTVPRQGGSRAKVEDFLVAKEPRRGGVDASVTGKAELEVLAARFNIRLPFQEIKEL